MSTKQIAGHFLEAHKVLSEFIEDETNFEKIKTAGDQIISSIKKGGKVKEKTNIGLDIIMKCGNRLMLVVLRDMKE